MKLKYQYYIIDYFGRNILYRIEKGEIGKNVKSLEVFNNGYWNDESKYIDFFMDNYVTGWINDDDLTSYENAVHQLSEKISLAKKNAIKKHTNQKYGIYPYEVHLINVINVLLKHNVFYNKLENIDLWIAGWLHDILEDTDYSKEEMIAEFGENVFQIVWALTDGDVGNRKQRKKVMFEKLIKNKDAIIIKLADRIANLEFSMIDNNKEKINLYVSENEEFNEKLFAAVQDSEIGKNLLNYLNELVINLQNFKIQNDMGK